MPSPLQSAWQSWALPVPLTSLLALSGLVYLRGWLHLRSTAASLIPGWRVGSYFFGLFLIWMGLGSPLAVFDEQLLTVHMIQHLLLMTIAPPLILLGAPVMPLLHGLPRQFVQGYVGPLFRWAPAQRIGQFISQPAICWFAATAALVGWHVPEVFALGLRSEAWHVVEHACFLGTGLLFWWPVIHPWPSTARPQWGILLYLFLATLPCDILSGFLVFCDRVVYPAYLNVSRPDGFSALQDQQCAAALMWTVVTVAYLIPAAILSVRLLSRQASHDDGLPQAELQDFAVRPGSPQAAD